MLVNENFFALVGCFQYAAFAASVIIYILLSYIVFRFSPPSIRIYRIYLFVNATLGLLFQVEHTLFRIETLMPRPTLALHGIADVFVSRFGMVSRKFECKHKMFGFAATPDFY